MWAVFSDGQLLPPPLPGLPEGEGAEGRPPARRVARPPKHRARARRQAERRAGSLRVAARPLPGGAVAALRPACLLDEARVERVAAERGRVAHHEEVPARRG